MRGKRCAMWAILVGVLGLTGCCNWCERNCPTCHAPVPPPAAPACYPPTAATPAGYGYPATSAYAAPAQAPAAGTTYQRPMNCNCTCTQGQ